MITAFSMFHWLVYTTFIRLMWQRHDFFRGTKRHQRLKIAIMSHLHKADSTLHSNVTSTSEDRQHDAELRDVRYTVPETAHARERIGYGPDTD